MEKRPHVFVALNNRLEDLSNLCVITFQNGSGLQLLPSQLHIHLNLTKSQRQIKVEEAKSKTNIKLEHGRGDVLVESVDTFFDVSLLKEASQSAEGRPFCYFPMDAFDEPVWSITRQSRQNREEGKKQTE